ALDDARLNGEGEGQRANISEYATPRRLALVVTAIAERSPDVKKTVQGPPAKAAFQDGKPTKAAEGFARKVGVPVSALRVEGDREEVRGGAARRARAGGLGRAQAAHLGGGAAGREGSARRAAARRRPAGDGDRPGRGAVRRGRALRGELPRAAAGGAGLGDARPPEVLRGPRSAHAAVAACVRGRLQYPRRRCGGLAPRLRARAARSPLGRQVLLRRGSQGEAGGAHRAARA